MKATIMIPAFNSERFIHDAMQSALAQTFGGDYEVLIVNDGSTDRTPEILESYRENASSSIRVIHQENKGIGSTRNVLLEQSRGEILLGLDHDDRLRPEALEIIVEEFDSKPEVGVVYADMNKISATDEVICVAEKSKFHSVFEDLIYFWHFLGHPRAYRKQHVQDFRFDANGNGDDDYGFVLDMLPFVKFSHVPKVVYDFRIHPHSTSTVRNGDLRRSAVARVKHHLLKRKIYGDATVEVHRVEIGNGVGYYDHIVNGRSMIKPSVRDLLREYASSG